MLLWWYLKLSFLKPWANQCVFLMELFFKAMLMKLGICFGICLSSKWFHLRLTFFPFLKPWVDNNSTKQYSYQLFYCWGMTHIMPPYLNNAHSRRGPGETPSALRCLSYLLNSFLTDIKQLAKTYGALSIPLLMSMSEVFSVPFSLEWNSATQKLWSDQAWSLVPKLNLWRSWIWYHSL